MNVLVTGYHGYVGSVLVPVLLGRGHNVIGLDTRFYRGCDFVEGSACPQAIHGDIRDRDVQDALRHCDAVVHLAALSNDPLGDLNPELTREINYKATLRIARAAKDAGARRFVFASSCSIYGATGEDEIMDEQSALRPITPYAESKVRCEEDLTRMADGDFWPVFLRNATAYGPSPRLRFDVVLNNLVGWAYTTGEVRLLSNGMAWRPLVHVRDICEASVAVLESPRDAVYCRAYNVGRGPENFRVKEIAEIVRKGVPGSCVTFGGAGGQDPRSYRVNFNRYASAFPAYPLQNTAEGGVAELFEDCRRTALTKSEFLGDRFMRLARLKSLLTQGILRPDLRWNAPADSTGIQSALATVAAAQPGEDTHDLHGDAAPRRILSRS